MIGDLLVVPEKEKSENLLPGGIVAVAVGSGRYIREIAQES